MSDEAKTPTLFPVSKAVTEPPKASAPKRRPKRRRWVWGLALLSIAGGGAFFAQKSRATAKPVDPALLVTVTKKSLDVEIFETGKIAPREKADLKSKVAGTVQQVFVEEGATVKKGDVLIALDPIDYQRDLEKNEAEIASISAALDFAGIQKERAERGVAQGIAPQTELLTTTQDERTKALQLKSAEVARNVSQDRLRYTRIVSPMSGTVIVRNIEPGESVVPGVQATMDGKPLLTIADLSTLLVKVNLNQIDVAKVSVGRTATLTLDALPGKSYEAKITKVAPASVKVTGKELEVFPVEALLEEPDGLVKPGMTADVRVHLDSKPNVLVVPIEAVVKEGGKSFVTTVETDAKGQPKQTQVEVTVGLRNDREVEVSGVAEGAKVMLKPGSSSANEAKM
ncbi:MAG: efflux RND transporter periplasmic adaptor subunit [Labilithrix sp.]|nr:efflux RND transporter periplasmic adaptor subunit [Labilithrix sp.]MCW5816388.1 efflux RND transporter periplasmic adaptor subunit [Labilithrix sp.]